MLVAETVSVQFGRRQVLERVSFQARPAAVTAIVGPNGSGKTTLLRCLAGELSHQGQVYLNGRALSALRPAEQASWRAVLPQSGQVAFPFTVFELVRLGLGAGLSRHIAEQGAEGTGPLGIVEAAIRRVGLAGYGGRLVQELSGGERQRAQLARVLAQIWHPMHEGQPRWLLLDEPVSALDIGHQLSIMQIARDFADAGGGVVAVMHDLNLTSMFADQIALMSQGRIYRQGPPQAVLTDGDLSACYGCPLRINTAPQDGRPWLLPQTARDR
ncbi:heme ABC transporter ATP-binding protein [Thioclava sp. GXIMD4216]|uniref:heme ABC transporter ATP-binding protein n=1 Tax=unclassified Thioclava TaxID=2621713 RepID=UPI0030CF8855